MNPFKRKSRFEKMVDSLRSNDALKSAAITAAETAVASATSRRQAEKLSKALESLDSNRSSHGLKSKVKSGLMVAAGTAAVVAASASVSSRRRRDGESES